VAARDASAAVGDASLAAFAAKAAATTVPVVFATGTDPVRDGLVASLNRPGANFTGVIFITSELGTKRLELLRQLVPKATTVAMLVGPSGTETEVERADVAKAAQALGLSLVVADATSRPEIEAAFVRFAQRSADAVLVGTGALTNSNREAIVALAAHHSIPAIYSLREYVSIGGLMSYGTSITEAYRQAGIYAGRILKGERPADLPEREKNRAPAAILSRETPPTATTGRRCPPPIAGKIPRASPWPWTW
jgi:putative ABC transport system substrate-binding protein